MRLAVESCVLAGGGVGLYGERRRNGTEGCSGLEQPKPEWVLITSGLRYDDTRHCCYGKRRHGTPTQVVVQNFEASGSGGFGMAERSGYGFRAYLQAV